MNALNCSGISLQLDGKTILNNIHLTVPQGHIYGLVGHNGAGKTSLLNILLGFYVRYEGQLQLFDSSDLSKQRIRIGSVADTIRLDERCTAGQYLHNLCLMNGINDTSYDNKLLKQVGLPVDSTKKIKEFSLGMKRRLLIACALIGDVNLLIMDEPFNGIDPRGMAEIRLVLQMLAADGVTILVTSHIISELIKLADTVGVMYEGRFIGELRLPLDAQHQYKKTVVHSKKAFDFIMLMKSLHQEMYCSTDRYDEVSVFGEHPYDEISDVCSEIGVKREDISYEYLSEEDVLLWCMEGYAL